MMLKKTSIYLDQQLDHRLARRAADEGVTKAEFIRRLLPGAGSRRARPNPHALDPRLAGGAADEGGRKPESIRRILTGAVSRPTRPKPQAIGFEDRRR